MENGHNPSSLRVNNIRVVLDILQRADEVTVSQISEQVQLSKTTLWKIMDFFVEQNLAISVGKSEGSEERGKKPELYRFNEAFGYVIAITFFGGTIILALTDAKMSVFYKEIIYIAENERIDHVVSIIAAFIAKWQSPGAPRIPKGARLLGIVIAGSGVTDTKAGTIITASRFSSWPSDVAFKALLEEQVTFQAPFYIDNYNRFFAFAEKTLGCARGYRNIIDIVAGWDGIGAGIIAEGNLKRGPRFLTGEVGHMCLNPADEEICHCGGRGCFEQLASTDRLLMKAERGRPRHPDSIIYKQEPGMIVVGTIFDAANSGDPWACELLEVVIGWFAIALLNISLVFNAEIIVISGDYRKAGPYFLKRLNERIEDTSLTRMRKNLLVVYSQFDDEGALLGGASFVVNRYFAKHFEY